MGTSFNYLVHGLPVATRASVYDLRVSEDYPQRRAQLTPLDARE